jgi:hypothetical protein
MQRPNERVCQFEVVDLGGGDVDDDVRGGVGLLWLFV